MIVRIIMPEFPNFVQAIRCGNVDEVNCLLDSHTDWLNAETDQGISPLMLAIYHRQEDIIQSLLGRDPIIKIFEAAALGMLPVLEHHFKCRPESVNTYSCDGFTPLGLSSFFGQLEAAECLIRFGADVNQTARNDFRVTPLHSAAAANDFKMAELLVEHGAEVNIRQRAGVTPLHSAAHNGNIDLTRLLLDNDADTNARLDSGETPLCLALSDEHQQVAELLRQYGADA